MVNKYRLFEEEKKRLIEKNLSNTEYEKAIRDLIKKYKI